jgi:hypothetical protein
MGRPGTETPLRSRIAATREANDEPHGVSFSEQAARSSPSNAEASPDRQLDSIVGL